MKIIYKYTPINHSFSSRGNNKVRWIVIHDTANKERGANAKNHYKYFKNNLTNSSAHYFVDDKEIYQIIGDNLAAWHCGDNQGYGRALNGCTNLNSLGIELCINKDGNYWQAYYNLVELVKNLMKRYNLTADSVCRHHDVSKKRCPGSFFDKPGLWESFKEEIKKPIKVTIDLDKDSVNEEDDKMILYKGQPWSEKAREWAEKYKISDLSNLDKPATREELITMLYRFYNLIKEEEKNNEE